MDGEAVTSIGSFQPGDYAAFGVILSISCLIGIYFAWKYKHESSLDGYFLAGRSMNPIAVGMSMLVTYLSAIGLVSQPAEVYIVGDMQLWSGIMRSIGIVITMVYLIPTFRRLNLRTMVQYFGLRFNIHIRRLAALMATLTSMILTGLVIYAASVTLSAVTPITISWSIMITSVVCIFYTSLGGMKAVIWTDAIQTFFMVGGSLALFIEGLIAVGGFKELNSALARGQRHTFLRFDFGVISRVSPLAFVFGQFTLCIFTYGFSQQTMQRYLSCKTTTHAQWATGLNMLFGSLVTISTFAVGLVLFAIYESCDPVYSGEIESIDQIVPYTTLRLFSDLPGMSGLFVAAVFSAALSTISSNLNAYSIVIIQELLCVIWKPLRESDRLKVFVGKVTVVFLGLIVVGIAFAASFSSSNIIQLLNGILGIMAGPITGAYVLGFFFPKANSLVKYYR